MVSIALIILVAISVQYGQCGISEGDKQAAVDLHNQYRIEAKATSMQKLKWNTELENFAQRSANKCAFDHTSYNDRENIAGFQYIGENIYTASEGMGEPTMKQAIDDWASEKKDYHLDSNSCTSSMCLHYTQMVWANTTDVGCAISHCDAVQGFTGEPGYLIFCNYGTGGNVVGVKPYEQAGSGDVGSKCQEVFKEYSDSNGLCDTNAPSAR